VTAAPGAPLTRIERIGLAAGLALAGVLVWPLRGYLTDDTYIHLQYARHLAAGQGLVFNVGERVFGCTSPLWVALVAGGIRLGADGLIVARLLGFLATLGAVVLFFSLARRSLRTPELRAIATLAWAGHAWMLRWSLSGMETPLAVALVLAGFVTFAGAGPSRWRSPRTGVLWALAALTRPEAALLLALWVIASVLDRTDGEGWERVARRVAPGLAICGGWLLFARIYFGGLWPNTLAAKAAGSDSLAFQVDNLWRQIRIVAATDGAVAALLAAALVFGRGTPRPGGPWPVSVLPWAWLAGVPALYAARGVPVLSRYLLPLLPVMAWLAWRAADRWWMGEAPVPATRRRAAALGVAIGSLVLVQNLTVYRLEVVPHVVSFSQGFRGSLVKWGRWFGEHAPVDASIATPDIGAIGYFGERRVIDLAGLVTPRMIPLLRAGLPEDVVKELRFAAFARPEFLVDRAPVANDLLRRSPYAACLVPLGHASVPNLGIARPGEAVYSFYRVDWACFDSLRARR
jgi:hypothetical protein